ncbi:hypothetical protein [Arthrospira platensis]|uniref:Uncharacterized protein n=1 Tax=Limnospira platensis NIES-46 TaxID=1236695 RepID=A0A5M3T4W5_LIMPL|nr:hypothetical protein [Arthrospira platensis]AMW28468.1 hypothetical protein AP285_11305 [Arthrospira platensis YZ]KDR56411.1 hypothetical protein APPUASWS_017065 [Arthrospira platensis str. Paraca]MBD2572950.1 hypothetical protein [Arthrospira platensis FACHB-971]MBD2669470.1 hypothetical protein [Arthrospira platensis FACHB-439]MBD2710006.1 hypothetical protein [Arthrospira platensis FACHB-835]MDF2209675.1 hypothetical protein [Arthrospira platensis NCB002]MDT9182529.1 hypothetical prote
MWKRDYKILSELIDESAQIKAIALPYNSREVILTEADQDVKYSIKIKGFPPEFFIIKSDKFAPPVGFIQGLQGECKRSDYIILVNILLNQKSQKTAIFLELKRGNPDNQDIIKQLKGGFCLFKYLQKIGQVFWGKPDFLKDYDIKFVVIKNIPMPGNLNKRSSQFKRENLVKSLKIDGDNIEEIPKHYLSVKHQKEIYFRVFLEKA